MGALGGERVPEPRGLWSSPASVRRLWALIYPSVQVGTSTKSSRVAGHMTTRVASTDRSPLSTASSQEAAPGDGTPRTQAVASPGLRRGQQALRKDERARPPQAFPYLGLGGRRVCRSVRGRAPPAPPPQLGSVVSMRVPTPGSPPAPAYLIGPSLRPARPTALPGQLGPALLGAALSRGSCCLPLIKVTERERKRRRGGEENPSQAGF